MSEKQAKRCIRCGVVKPLDDFATASRCKDGHTGVCKGCLYQAARIYWFHQHRERAPWRIAPDVSVCVFCGKKFKPRDGRQRYCSELCKRRMQYAKAASDGS